MAEGKLIRLAFSMLRSALKLRWNKWCSLLAWSSKKSHLWLPYFPKYTVCNFNAQIFWQCLVSVLCSYQQIFTSTSKTEILKSSKCLKYEYEKAALREKRNVKINKHQRYGPLNHMSRAAKVQVVSPLMSWGWIFPFRETLQRFVDKLRQMFESSEHLTVLFSSVCDERASCWLLYWKSVPFFFCISTKDDSNSDDVSQPPLSVLQTFLKNLPSNFDFALIGWMTVFFLRTSLFTLF